MARPRAPKSMAYTWHGPPRWVSPADTASVRSNADLPLPPVPNTTRLPSLSGANEATAWAWRAGSSSTPKGSSVSVRVCSRRARS